MKILFAIVACVCLTLSLFQRRESEAWRRLVPLHSTRKDVERLLGPSEEKCKCFYKTENESIFVHYSDGLCNGFLHGWNVTKDTVLMITVQSNTDIRLSDLSLDLTKYVRTPGTDVPEVFYTDKDAGVRYQVSESGIVRSVTYIPRRADYPLRCKGFPSIPDLGHREFKPFDTFSNISIADEQARLDNFSIWLREQPKMKGYILVYASKDIPSNKARVRAQRAKDYLIKRRRMDSKKLDIIDGGYREHFEIELYILPRDVGPPTPYPTLAPSASSRMIRWRVEKPASGLCTTKTGARPAICD